MCYWSRMGGDQYYGPLVNLVGFDSITAKKKHLRLCSAVTVVEHPIKGPFLLRIHQAVHNPDAEDTLLSEYQLNQGVAGLTQSLQHMCSQMERKVPSPGLCQGMRKYLGLT